MTIKQIVSNPSLNLVIAVVFLLIYIPGLGFLLLNAVIDGGARARLEQQRGLIQKMDESINYDNRITKVTRKVIKEDSQGVEQVFFDKNGYLFAGDVSIRNSEHKMELKSRTYYDKIGSIIARDVYESGNNISDPNIYVSDVVKRREYFNQNEELIFCEYFDKSGVPIVFENSGNVCGVGTITILSPFPPLFYFYR